MYYKKSRLKILMPFLFILIFVNGCKNDKIPAPNSDVRVVNKEEISKMINERDGRLLFINVWATWCKPCVEEFPDIIKTVTYFSNKNVDFISLSVDLPSERDSLVIPFVEKQNVNFPVYIVKESQSEEIIEMLNQDWSGAIPATFIYDKNGTQQKFLLGSQDYNKFKNSIDSVLSL